MPERSQIVLSFLPAPDTASVEWRIEPGLTEYEHALAFMDARADAIRQGSEPEMVWLVEHPPLYTAGTSARIEDLVEPDRFPVFAAGRGGEYTYHGPGQRVAYVMLDLKRRREDRVGVWVVRPDRPPMPDGSPAEDKIAAIGVRLRRWVSFHGIAINVEPNLSHVSGIVPCGVADRGVTSLVDLGLPVTMADLDTAMKAAFAEIFGTAHERRNETRKAS